MPPLPALSREQSYLEFWLVIAGGGQSKTRVVHTSLWATVYVHFFAGAARWFRKRFPLQLNASFLEHEKLKLSDIDGPLEVSALELSWQWFQGKREGIMQQFYSSTPL